MENLIWSNEKRKLNELKEWERNPRIASEKQKTDLEKSIERFSLADPIIINRDNTIIGGHFRYKILKERGVETVDVRVPNRQLTERELEELNLRLNKNTGSFDIDALANFDEEFLKDVGWEKSELDEIFDFESYDDEFDIGKELNKILEGGERRVKEGDIWQLGMHRLIIGDAVKKEIWGKLLGEERFDFLFTDPPYNLKVIKPGKGEGFGVKENRVYLGVRRRGGVPEYDEWLSIANEYQNPRGANVMVFENWRNIREIWNAIEKYWEVKNIIVWYAPNRRQGWTRRRSFYSQYDFILLAGDGILNEEYEEELENYLKERGQKLLDTYEIIIYGQQGESYWDKPRGTRWAGVEDHITSSVVTDKSGNQAVIWGTKPIQILVPYIKVLSPRNGILMDCFGGSGSTLIACEMMKRKCRMIEIEPLYGEVILYRWEKFTGKKAEKIGEMDT